MDRHINEIVLHCSATRPGWMDGHPLEEQVAEIRRWHVEGNGWSDIGYHFLIGRCGELAAGRTLARPGAHVRGHNANTIGICLIGGHGSAATDSFTDHFTADQRAATRALVAVLRWTLGNLRLSGHNEYAAKACPGFNVRDEFDDILDRNAGSVVDLARKSFI